MVPIPGSDLKQWEQWEQCRKALGIDLKQWETISQGHR